MGGVIFDTNVFISYASSALPPEFPAFMRQYVLAYEAKLAVQVRDVARCARVWLELQDLSDEDWDAIEPDLVEEIAMLHDLCADDKDLG